MIIVIRSIFCPNDHYYKVTMEGIDNMLKYFLDVDVIYYFYGWVREKTHYISLKHYLDDNGFFGDLCRINYGKLYHFSNLINLLSSGEFLLQDDFENILIYFDHDILLDGTLDHDLLKNSISLFKNSNAGILAFNQLVDNRHQLDIYNNSFLECDLELGRSDTIYSIALGAYIISYDCLLSLTLSISSVYGLDDSIIIKSCIDNGYNVYVLLDYYIIHPFDTNLFYKHWKINMVSKLIENDISYMNSIESSLNFWNGFI